MKKPYITSTVTIPNSKDPSHIAIEIKNQGFEPAKNLTLTMLTPESIQDNSITYFAAENVTIHHAKNSHFVVFKAKRFSQGPGDLLQVEMTLEKALADPNKNIVIYSTYDDGSNISEPIDFLHSIEFAINGSNNYQAGFVLLLSILSIIAIMAIFYIRRRTERAFMVKVKTDIISIMRRLQPNPNEIFFLKYDSFFGRNPFGWYKPLSFRWDRPFYKGIKIRTFNDMGDWKKIDDFYDKIMKRESAVRKLGKREIDELNKDCLAECYKVLQEIKWEKYIY